MRSLSEFFDAVKIALGLSTKANGSLSCAGLIVATSNSGLASAAILFTGAGGSGIAHAVSGVARVSVSGIGAPWLQLPEIELPSGFSLPSKVAPAAAIVILSDEPSRVTLLTGIGGAG